MKVAYLPLYVRDWRSDPKVALLSWSERAVYLDMLMLSWELGPLPTDAAAVLRGIGWDGDQAEGASIVERVLKAFWRRLKGGWENPRLEAERERTEALVERRSALGKKAAASRWDSVRHADGNASGIAVGIADGNPKRMPRAPEPEPEPEPEPFPSSEESLKSDTPSLRSGVGAAAPGMTPGLPGIEITPPKGKRQPTQSQIDGFVARGVWLRCWQRQFGKPYTDLRGRKSSSVRTAFVRLGRNEAELERLVGAFLAAPPFKHQENPDPIAFLDSLSAIAAGLNGKDRTNGTPRSTRRPDGTRPGEYPEPIQFPRVVNLDG